MIVPIATIPSINNNKNRSIKCLGCLPINSLNILIILCALDIANFYSAHSWFSRRKLAPTRDLIFPCIGLFFILVAFTGKISQNLF